MNRLLHRGGHPTLVFAYHTTDFSKQLVATVEALLQDLNHLSLEMVAILGAELGARHDHDRNQSRLAAPANGLDEFETIHGRKEEVEQNEVRPMLFHEPRPSMPSPVS